MDLPPQQPAPPLPSRRRFGLGCFATGCFTLLAIGFLGLVALFATAWFFFGRAIDVFTSGQPANIALEVPGDEQYTAANDKLNQLRTALRQNQAATLAFTAADLNALIERHPDFASRKGKLRIAIADSVATVEMSVPLDTIDFSKAKHRWFNGRANFTFIYAQEGFEFDPRWIEANGHRLSSGLLGWSASVFNRSFTAGFKKAVEDDGDDSDFWRNVKTMTLDRDQLVVITKGERGAL